ncbi:MAG: hypothetical protein OQJ84_09520 [Xanthomonadales bacterium]|nr:hypothetical protein [Xanthomonadales bacterium]
MQNKQPAVLICIYTCESHKPFHAEFHESRIGKYLDTFTNARQIYVSANPELSTPRLDMDQLTVNTVESYSNLCQKTFKMIRYCAERIPFDYLVKMDVTSGIESMNLNPEIVNRVSNQQVMINYLKEIKNFNVDDMNSDYTGWRRITANRDGVERWAKLKDVKINYVKMLGEGVTLTYYSGKCYTISRRFAKYIGKYGDDLTRKHTRYLPSEDMLIGRLYEGFSKSLS